MSVAVSGEISAIASAGSPPGSPPGWLPLQCTRPSSVLWCELCNQTFAAGPPPTLYEFYYCAETIRERDSFCLAVLTHAVRDLFEGRKNRGNTEVVKHVAVSYIAT